MAEMIHLTQAGYLLKKFAEQNRIISLFVCMKALSKIFYTQDPLAANSLNHYRVHFINKVIHVSLLNNKEKKISVFPT